MSNIICVISFKNNVQRFSCLTVLIKSGFFTFNVNVSVRSSVAPTAAKKRKITQRLLALSVEHQFVTPVTALLVESEDGPERLLADSPRDPRHGCCPGAGSNNNNHQHHHHLLIMNTVPHEHTRNCYPFLSLDIDGLNKHNSLSL